MGFVIPPPRKIKIKILSHGSPKYLLRSEPNPNRTRTWYFLHSTNPNLTQTQVFKINLTRTEPEPQKHVHTRALCASDISERVHEARSAFHAVDEYSNEHSVAVAQPGGTGKTFPHQTPKNLQRFETAHTSISSEPGQQEKIQIFVNFLNNFIKNV